MIDTPSKTWNSPFWLIQAFRAITLKTQSKETELQIYSYSMRFRKSKDENDQNRISITFPLIHFVWLTKIQSLIRRRNNLRSRLNWRKHLYSGAPPWEDDSESENDIVAAADYIRFEIQGNSDKLKEAFREKEREREEKNEFERRERSGKEEKVVTGGSDVSLEPLTSPLFHFYGRAKASYHYLIVLCLQTTSCWSSLGLGFWL